jgi:hypothetical protein
VELGEVEAALASLPGVQLAVALVLQDPAGAQQLVAYVTPAELASAALAAGLRERLPAHMVPSVVVPLARMPLLPNEKIDRKALPPPAWGSHEAAQYVAPADELEARLQAVWQQVLGRERISTADDFFAVGGNSLQVPLAFRLSLCAARLAGWHPSRVFRRQPRPSLMACTPAALARTLRQASKVMIAVRREVGCEVPTAQLFRTPTIAALAAALSHASAGGRSEAGAIPRASFSAEQRAAGVPCSANQEQMLALYQMQPDSAAYNMVEAMRLRGKPDARALEAALAFLARRHETLRTHFVERDGLLLQAVYPAGDPRAAPALQRRSLPPGSDEAALDAALTDAAEQPYEVIGERVPLRAVLFAVGPDEHVLLIGNHHILRCARINCTQRATCAVALDHQAKHARRIIPACAQRWLERGDSDCGAGSRVWRAGGRTSGALTGAAGRPVR